jgi:protein-export membrane protein SecD
MTRNNIAVLIIIIIVFSLSFCVLLHEGEEELGPMGMHLGLDLVGGVHLVYQADFEEGASTDDMKNDIERAVDTIERRINELGVTEPKIYAQDNERIIVQLPGFTDIEAAKEEVEKSGYLEFREAELDEAGSPVYLRDYLDNDRTDFFDTDEPDDRIFVIAPDQTPLVFLEKDEAGKLVFTDRDGVALDTEELKKNMGQILIEFPGEYTLLSWIPARGQDGTHLTGDLLANAQPDIRTQTTGAEAMVNIEWNKEGGIIFDDIAARLYYAGPDYSPQRALAIFLDKTLLSHPNINVPKYEGSGVIQGNFTVDEATKLARRLRSGSLPMPLKQPPLYEEKVSATLGANFIDTSVKAGIIGILLVMLFMIIYYRLPGFLASLALVFYGALVLALFKLIPVTLTLAGIGGFVLSIGMAVDANVLIFERIKEELRTGRTIGAAIEAGFNRAWTAIRDSNVTTFIVCGILYWLGSSIVASAPVMGFALTLFIGVAVSMLTAIIVTRTLLRLSAGTGLAHRRSLYTVSTGKK